MMLKRAVLVCSSLLLATLAGAAERTVVEGIVVRVNDRILTIEDLRQRISERSAEMGRPLPPENVPALIQEAADELVLLERAEELKMDVTSDEVTAAVRQLREQNNVVDEATFEGMLSSLGITSDQLRRRLRESILINRVLSTEMGELPVTEAELRQRWERDKEQFRRPAEVHLQHVVIPLGSDAGEQQANMRRAERLVAAARSGEPFERLVAAEVESTGAAGGDLGTVAIPDLKDEVRQAVEELEPGQVSDPFTSSTGIHVVHLVERTPSSIPPFSEVVDALRERELGERYRGRLRGVVDDLKRRYVVETHPELLDRSP